MTSRLNVALFLSFSLTSVLTYPALAQAGSDAKGTDASRDSIGDVNHPLTGTFVVRSYRITNMTQQTEGNEIVVALRNILHPSVRIYMDFSANTIVLAAPPDQQSIAQSLITKLDVSKPTYRLVYTLTEFEDGKRIGTQHYAMTAADGQRVSLKQGTKVPVEVSSDHNTAQFQYIDVGMNFSVEADAVGSGVLLKSKVEQSSVPEDKTIAGVQEPIVRQAVLEGASVVQFGKPFILGSMDVLSSTRRIDVEVLVEPVSPSSSR